MAFLVYYSPAFLSKEDKAPPVDRLTTGGTSSVQLMIENRWRSAYRQAKGIQIDYSSAGSTVGVKRLIEKDFAIAFTHAAMTAEQEAQARSTGGKVVQIPVLLCAAVPIYNVKELHGKAPLRFSGEVLADIFLGKIATWNDPALRQINEGVDLPDKPITVVHRADSSGTTFIFSEYLAGASQAWREKFGSSANSELKWPVGVGKPRNAGVAYHVMDTDGAIGYVDLVYAGLPDVKFQDGAVQNKDRSAFIKATPENMTAALKGLSAGHPADLVFSLTNQPGRDAYPISGVIYAACYRVQPAAHRQKVVDFLHWVIHDGQKYAAGMSYAPLTPELVERADQAIDLIKADH